MTITMPIVDDLMVYADKAGVARTMVSQALKQDVKPEQIMKYIDLGMLGGPKAPKTIGVASTVGAGGGAAGGGLDIMAVLILAGLVFVAFFWKGGKKK